MQQREGKVSGLLSQVVQTNRLTDRHIGSFCLKTTELCSKVSNVLWLDFPYSNY